MKKASKGTKETEQEEAWPPRIGRIYKDATPWDKTERNTHGRKGISARFELVPNS